MRHSPSKRERKDSKRGGELNQVSKREIKIRKKEKRKENRRGLKKG